VQDRSIYRVAKANLTVSWAVICLWDSAMRRVIRPILIYFRRVFLDEDYGLYLLFGLILSLLSLFVFFNVAEDVVEGDSLVLFDHALANALYQQATDLSTAAYRVITWFGAPGATLLGIAVGSLLILRRQWLHLVFWITALSGASMLNLLMKVLFARPRPVFENPLLVESFYSFPSGHSMNAIVTYGVLAYLLWLQVNHPIARSLIVFAATLAIVLIGISRMALGVHYFSDVIGGFAAGGLWLGVCIVTMNLYQRRQR
jgi:undecaprenyl-diphosphatase